MATKATIEIDLEIGGASEAIKKIQAAFKKLEEDAAAANDALGKGEGAFKRFGKAANKIKGQLNNAAKSAANFGKKVGLSMKSLKAVGAATGIAVAAIAAAGAAFKSFMAAGKEAAMSLRGEFDPLVASLAAVDKELQEVHAIFGDIEIASDVALKKAMLPAWKKVGEVVDENKVKLTEFYTKWKVDAIETTAKVVNVVLKVFSSATNLIGQYFNRIKAAAAGTWLVILEGAQKVAGALPEFLGGGDDLVADIEALSLATANSMDGYLAAIDKANQKTGEQFQFIDDLTEGFMDLGDEAEKSAGRIASSMGRATGITQQQFQAALNGLVATLRGPLQQAYTDSFLSDELPEDMKKSLQSLQQLVAETNRVSQALNLMSESADPALFNQLLGEVQKLYDAMGVPLTLNFDGMQEAQKIEALRKAMELLKIEGEITAEQLGRELGAAMESAAAAGGTATAQLKANMSALQAHTEQVGVAMTNALLGALSSASQAFGAFIASANDATMTAAERQKELAKAIGQSFLGIFETIINLMIQKKIMTEAFAAAEIATSASVTAAKNADSASEAAGNIAPAATGAVKSQSWLPVVGPWLGIAAALMIVGFMKGLIGGMNTGGFVPGSWGAGGGVRPDTIPKFLTPGEYVMPADEQRGLSRFMGAMGVPSPTPNRRGAQASQNIQVSFSSTLPTNRTEAKKIMQRDVVPLLRSLRSGGY